MMTEAYCVKCKKKTQMNDPHEVTMKNGKRAMKGTCSVCGTTMQTFLKESKKA
jgi:hypothetical protein